MNKIKSLYAGRTHKTINWYQHQYSKGRINDEDIKWAIEQKIPQTLFQFSDKNIHSRWLTTKLLFLNTGTVTLH